MQHQTLRQAREAAGLSLEAVAAAAEPPLDPSSIWRMESGQRKPSADAERRWRRALVKLAAARAASAAAAVELLVEK